MGWGGGRGAAHCNGYEHVAQAPTWLLCKAANVAVPAQQRPAWQCQQQPLGVQGGRGREGGEREGGLMRRGVFGISAAGSPMEVEPCCRDCRCLCLPVPPRVSAL
eukprot:59434-Chlamydomonas_euryale.AAC.3